MHDQYGLQGSPEKDIVAQPEGKVIGAYIMVLTEQLHVA